ncbi:hypothetical protein CBER1_10932 [Cercospora berteroae]|uniref:Uncharacterized protein n=1 Tax=Cercospora berteroae TaxID=357750 RepID=A0A2S6C9W9_9PEZI|nr:hypothetical protein CBER1_10932 [Cercospora berteroae]
MSVTSVWAFAAGIVAGYIGGASPPAAVDYPPLLPPPRVLVIHTGPSTNERVVEALLIGIGVALMTCLLLAPSHISATCVQVSARVQTTFANLSARVQTTFTKLSVHVTTTFAKASAYGKNTAIPRLEDVANAIGRELGRMVGTACEALGGMQGNKEELETSQKFASATEGDWVLITKKQNAPAALGESAGQKIG